MSIIKRIILFVLFSAFASLASAQATRTWVSGVGDDANPCSRTAPCKTFAGAISKTAARGKINVLDPGGYGAVTITKSITIEADGDVAGILSSGTSGIIVNAAATDDVVIRNIKFEGIGSGLSGIRVLSAATVLIDHCVIEDFTDFAVDIAPTASASKVTIRDSVFRRAGNLSTEALVRVQPTVPGSVFLVIDGTELFASKSAVRLRGPVKFSIRNSSMHGGDLNGLVLVDSGVDSVNGILDTVGIYDFPGSAILASGANSAVRVTNSTINNNGTGLATSGGGQIISFGDNRLGGNSLNGAFTSAEARQ